MAEARPLSWYCAALPMRSRLERVVAHSLRASRMQVHPLGHLRHRGPDQHSPEQTGGVGGGRNCPRLSRVLLGSSGVGPFPARPCPWPCCGAKRLSSRGHNVDAATFRFLFSSLRAVRKRNCFASQVFVVLRATGAATRVRALLEFRLSRSLNSWEIIKRTRRRGPPVPKQVGTAVFLGRETQVTPTDFNGIAIINCIRHGRWFFSRRSFAIARIGETLRRFYP